MRRFFAFAISFVSAGAAMASGGGNDVYYVGLNTRQTLTSGAYSGLADPNRNRLSFLYAHYTPGSEHFHGIGNYSYTGPASGPTVLDTNAGNRLPELYQRPTGFKNIPLTPGSGPLNGLFTSGNTNGEYDNLMIRPYSALAGSSDPADQALFNAGARFGGSMASVNLALEVVSITPGFKVSSSDISQTVDAAGQKLNIGSGNFAFKPIFWTAGSTPLGTNMEVTFRLVDLNAADPSISQSGRFGFDVQVVPEPATMAVLGLGIAALMRRRKS